MQENFKQIIISALQNAGVYDQQILSLLAKIIQTKMMHSVDLNIRRGN